MQQEEMIETATHPAPQEQAIPDIKPGQQVVAAMGGLTGPEPTRYGDWEKNGRCIDF